MNKVSKVRVSHIGIRTREVQGQELEVRDHEDMCPHPREPALQ